MWRLTAIIPVLVLLAGCSGGADRTPAGRTISVVATDAGCAPDPASVPAGGWTFAVHNDGADGVTEVELLRDGDLVAERENLGPGLSGTFSATLAEGGSYTVACPGADEDSAALTVTAAAAADDGAPSAEAAKAAAGYARWVARQASELVTRTRGFVRAVDSGDLDRARTLYPTARTPYERIEPVAESFGDLDPRIDARAGDVAAGQAWTGFHRLEHALWRGGTSPAAMHRLGARLLADVRELAAKTRHATYQPAQLANGSVELLDEVARSKVTGEEDRYSHTDLWDFAANVDGARVAFRLLAPVVRAEDASLARQIEDRFDTVERSLARHRRDGRFVSYDQVGAAERRRLAQQVDALAEPLSRVGAIVVAR